MSALRLATLVVDATTIGAVPVATSDSKVCALISKAPISTLDAAPSIIARFCAAEVVKVDPDTSRLPSTLATKVPVVIVKFPVDAPVNEPVPKINLSADSSHPINALSESPLSSTIPMSFAGDPVVPLPNSIKRSDITLFVVLSVVVVPLTVKLPPIVTAPEKVPVVPVSPPITKSAAVYPDAEVLTVDPGTV